MNISTTTHPKIVIPSTRVTIDAIGFDRSKPMTCDIVAERVIKKYDLSRDGQISTDEATVARHHDQYVGTNFWLPDGSLGYTTYDRYAISETMTLLTSANANHDQFTTRDELACFFRNQAGEGAAGIDFATALKIDNAHLSTFGSPRFVERIEEPIRW